MSSSEGFAIRRNGTCLAGLEVDCGITSFPYRGCCPTGLACPAAYNIACCTPNTACTDNLIAAPQPRCANPTWDLFDNAGYFCCEHGLQGYNRSGFKDGCLRPGEVLGEGDVVLSVVRVGEASLRTSSDPATATATIPVKNSGSDNKPIGAIVGGTLGGVAALTLTCILIWVILRRRRQRKAKDLGSQTHEVNPVEPKGHDESGKAACEVDSHPFQEADGKLVQTELPTVHAPAELPGTQHPAN
ncbi:hypothetical protein T440DRAFT_555417 [Plenodomus tracheiphilus IPT5]|uniref:Uncharacterized protein n=1 Tax=Plenodomus tracheiphilus IPT5 TaxID=1408161 RepID=A0A6A7B4L6_9PLEO|nr:hypothetical protein T440DRAFT_555417 [Plenodomus tracheiphilus IPT5]